MYERLPFHPKRYLVVVYTRYPVTLSWLRPEEVFANRLFLKGLPYILHPHKHIPLAA